MKLTQKSAAAIGLPQGKRDVIFFDDDIAGFGLRLRSSGKRVWIFQYALGAKQRRMTFGNLGAMNATKARETAEMLHAQVKLGQDPAGVKAESRARAHETFEHCARQYLADRRKRMRPRSYAEIERHLLVNAKPLHRLGLGKVDQRNIASRLTEIASDKGDTTANRTRATLSAFFTWAIKQGLTDSNPAAFTAKNEEKSRDRVLSRDELREIWAALHEGDYGDVVKLLALTGQRAGEISGLRWSEIMLDNRLDPVSVILPKERVKNKRAHVVPLAPMAKDILKTRARSVDRDLVFGAGTGGFSGWSKAKLQLDAAILANRRKAAEEAGGKREKVKPIEPWVLHDLRRTAATLMAEIGVQPHVIEAILNHVSGHKAGVAGIYNRNPYEAEKATALARWAEHVASLVENRKSTVTALRQAC